MTILKAVKEIETKLAAKGAALDKREDRLGKKATLLAAQEQAILDREVGLATKERDVD